MARNDKDHEPDGTREGVDQARVDDVIDTKVQEIHDKVKKLDASLAEKDKRIAELENDVKWQRADFENYRKGVEKRLDSDKEGIKGRVLKDFLPFIDAFDKAMCIKQDIAGLDMPGPVKNFLGGLEGLHKNLEGIISGQGLARIDAIGKPFDYNYHEVMMQVEDAEKDEDIVAHEIQKGWLLGTKVLRPAMVAVTKKPAPPPAPPAGDDATDGANADRGQADPGDRAC